MTSFTELRRDGIHLEAGCGAGYWVAALRHAGYCVEGVEYATELVEHEGDGAGQHDRGSGRYS